jgi:alpha-ketoglutarate-dependent taurine dioxygenase
MIDIVPINFTSIEEIKNNFDFYKNNFIENSVIVFRNANLTQEEHGLLSELFGEKFDWTVRYNMGEPDKYIEDHSRLTKNYNTTKDEILVFWHLEHVYYKNPIVAATWNMLVFNTSKENGKTYFVDSSKLYEKLPDEWKNFLNNSVVNTNEEDPETTIDNFSPVGIHWMTNKPVIRLLLDKSNGSTNKLVSINGQTPTKEELRTFKDICIWFNHEVTTNEEIRMVHKWQKGDLVLVDLFKLAHAVTGGFDSIDRKFVGMWGYK